MGDGQFNEGYDDNGGQDPNGENNGGGEGEDIDQYFDPVDDVGYLPADHVPFNFEFITPFYSP